MDDTVLIEPLSSPDLFALIASDSALLRAWSEVRAADAEDGIISRRVRDFERDLFESLEQLSGELESGSWSPGFVRTWTLTTVDPPRLITESQVRDRIVEKSIAEVISRSLDPGLSPFSFAYRRGLGVRDAHNALRESLNAGWSHVVRTDVEAAFDSMPRLQVLDELAARLGDQRIVGLVEKLLARLDKAGLDGVGVPTGSAISPILLNVYLDQLDRELLQAGRLAIRYADDVAVPVESEADGIAVIDLIASCLETLGLRVNSAKTAVVNAADGVNFLGKRISGNVFGDDAEDFVHPQRVAMYVNGPGSLVRLRGGHVRVETEGAAIASTSIKRVRQLIISDGVWVTRPLVERCLAEGVDVVMVGQLGGYVGRVGRRRGGDVRIKQGQFRRADDAEASLRLASDMVASKISNMRVAILRDRRRQDESAISPPPAVAGTLERAVVHARKAYSTVALMGVEGAATRAYFDWLGDSLDPEWNFTGRNRRPPRDPVNAMLSFGYTLLSAELVSACEIAGLDPDLGFLHSPRWGRPSLALDLMEQWRPVLVDAAVLSLVRGKTVTPADFTLDPDLGCRMSARAKKAFIAAYERRLLTKAGSTAIKGRHAYRELLAVHARSLAGHLLDPSEQYVGYLWR